jgi:ribosomal-protein-alanine N-acetyltransferase
MSRVLDDAISVRHLAPGDADFIERLSELAFSEFGPEAGPRIRRMTEGESAEVFVAVRGRERLGFLLLEHQRDSGYISAIAVAKSERGRGVGARLMAAAERAGRRAGRRRLSLTTAQANLEALELFLKSGFEIVRQLPRYYKAGQDACVLVRSL